MVLFLITFLKERECGKKNKEGNRVCRNWTVRNLAGTRLDSLARVQADPVRLAVLEESRLLQIQLLLPSAAARL